MSKFRLMQRLEEKLEGEDLSDATIERTTIDVGQFCEWYRETTGEELEPRNLVSIDLQEYRGWLQRHDMKPATITRKFASIRKAITLLAPERLHELRWPKMPRAQKTSPSGLTRNERNAVIRATERMSSRDRCIIHLALHTGARASSIASVRLSDVELGARGGSITYRRAKGDNTYTVPLNVEVRDAIRRWIDERPRVQHDLLPCAERFPHDPISRWVIHHVIHRRLTRLLPEELAAKIRGSHCFRHDLARRLLDGDGGRRAPVPASDVAAICGHADARVTVSIYSSPSQSDLRRALDGIVGEEGEA